MAFLITAARYVTVSEGVLNSTIRGYTPNTRSIGTRPSRPAVLLIALNTIYRVTSLLRSGSSVAII
jgi:hypothetical protein